MEREVIGEGGLLILAKRGAILLCQKTEDGSNYP